MELSELDRRAMHRTAALLIASGLVFIAGVGFQPEALDKSYEMDTIAARYVAVAAHVGAYRWGNLVAGTAAVLAAVAIARLSRQGRPVSGLESAAVASFAIATAAWLVEVALRASIVVHRATDLAAGRVTSGTALTDTAIRGDGIFAAFSILAGAALVTLAIIWARDRVVGRPTAAALAIGGLASALFVQSDPIAITFIPPFVFLIGFLPAGMVLAWRTRKARSPAAAVDATTN
jgi:hypothetical protein